MTFLRFIWDLLTGRLHQRLAQLEADRASFAAHYNSHVVFARSKIAALGAHTNNTRAQLLSWAARVEDGKKADPVRVQVEAFTDADDEPTMALTDADIVMPKRRW